MNSITNVEKFFQLLDESSELLKEALDVTYLEALAEAGENIFQGTVLQNIDASLKEILERSVQTAIPDLEKEDVRKAFGFAVLKGMKEVTQAHHAMTPDSVALFMSYLVNKIIKKDSEQSILDLACGTGNLLTAVINTTHSTHLHSYAFEVDETLLKLAFVNANLQHQDISFFHQDSLKPVSIPKVDIVIADLPVGYYPNETIADNYQLKSEKGRSLIHHLLIEQAINKVKDGGFLLFLIPNFLFETEEAANLNLYIKNNAHVIGLLQLPATMFKAQQHAKSIFMLQKKGEGVMPPRQALLSELPSFTRKEALISMVTEIDKWFKQEF